MIVAPRNSFTVFCRRKSKGDPAMINRARKDRAGSVNADVIEVFASVQGEGIYLGERQTFVRFAGCNLACLFCDTAAKETERKCRIEKEAGSGAFEVRPNPLTHQELLSVVERLTPVRGTVSLTGGEPLLHAEFLQDFIPMLKNCGYRVYLETNGTLYDELALLVSQIDVIAMDIKLPSATGEKDFFEEHAKFLEIAKSTDVFVKAIITANTLEDEIQRCAEIIASVDSNIPLILQPVTPVKPEIYKPSPQDLLRLQANCLKMVRNVRIIPQCHKMVGLL